MNSLKTNTENDIITSKDMHCMKMEIDLDSQMLCGCL